MHLLVFGNARGTAALTAAMEASGINGVLYEDANDPQGVGVLTWSDDPTFFVDVVRPVLNGQAFANLTLKPEYTMMGRTYGHWP